MKRFSSTLLLVLFLGFPLGCSVQQPSGVVLEKLDSGTVEVALGSGEVRDGDQVTLIRYRCPPGALASWKNPWEVSGSCRTHEIGTGEIARVVNERVSIARIRSDLPVRRGDVVRLRG